MTDRQPSIHVTKKNLLAIIKKYGKIDENNIDEVFRICKNVSLDHRTNLSVKDSNKSKVKEVLDSPTEDANLLASIIHSIRVQLKHRSIIPIRQGSNEWIQIKILLPKLDIFCKDMNLTKRKGYILFMKTAFTIHKLRNTKMNINYISSWADRNYDTIVDYIRAEEEINNVNQDTKKIAYYIYELYISTIAKMTGIYPNHRSNPLEYIHFIKSALFIKAQGLDYDLFIKSQFKSLEWCNGIPEMRDLYGDKSIKRYYQFNKRKTKGNKTNFSV